MPTNQVTSRLIAILAKRDRVQDFKELPNGKKRKLVILKARIVVQTVEQVGISHYRVTLTNEGNASAYTGRCDLFAGTLSSITLKESLAFVLHPGQTRTLDFTNYAPTRESVHAIAYDPVADPFPVLAASAFVANQKNLVRSGTNPTHDVKIPDVWRQFDKGSGGYSAVPEAHKTWEGRNKNAADPDTRLSAYFKPMATAQVESQLVQDVSLISPAIDSRLVTEINRGNVSYTASALLSVYKQSTLDQAAFLVHLTGGLEQNTGYKQNITWQEYPLQGLVPKNPDKATIMLRSKRNFGQNNDGFFANITFQLKHRQIASIHKSLTQV